MLDENLPTYRFQISSDDPLLTLLYYTHAGSEPKADYLIKRPSPSSCPNQYALGLLDVTYQSLVYAEVLVKPTWSQPTLSAAEIRAQRERNGSSPPPMALTPDTFTINLYNPDQTVAVRRTPGKFGKSDVFEFEIPEKSFAEPSASQLDQDATQPADLMPKVLFRWKRDGKLNRDMTCYMSGRTVGGKKNKEPDITVALWKGGRSSKGHDGSVQIYQPNMARVDVEDRKGLEVVLLLSAEVVKDLWVNPGPNVFNATVTGNRTNTVETNAQRPVQQPLPLPARNNTATAGGLGGSPPAPNGSQQQYGSLDVETQRLQAMVREEERQAREREKQDAKEAKRMQREMEKEDADRRRREAEVERETERLRKQYGVPPPPPTAPRPGLSNQAQSHNTLTVPQQGNLSRPGPGVSGQRPRPLSVGQMPSPGLLGSSSGYGLNAGYYTGGSSTVQTGPPYQNYRPPGNGPGAPGNGGTGGGGKKKTGFGALFGGSGGGDGGSSNRAGPYMSGGAGSSGVSSYAVAEPEARMSKMQKKRSVFF